MTTDPPALVGLLVGSEPASWSAAGFEVTTDEVHLGSVTIRLAAAPVDTASGILGWDLTGVVDDIDGLVRAVGSDRPSTAGAAPHPNRASAIDHLVVSSPDLDRTTAALEVAGIDLRRIRDAGRMQQRFFRIGQVILELVGPPEAAGEGGARFWGLALTVDDLDDTARVLGHHLGPVADAVQPGRRIATLRHESVGLGLPIAFLSPPPPRP